MQLRWLSTALRYASLCLFGAVSCEQGLASLDPAVSSGSNEPKRSLTRQYKAAGTATRFAAERISYLTFFGYCFRSERIYKIRRNITTDITFMANVRLLCWGFYFHSFLFPVRSSRSQPTRPIAQHHFVCVYISRGVHHILVLVQCSFRSI